MKLLLGSKNIKLGNTEYKVIQDASGTLPPKQHGTTKHGEPMYNSSHAEKKLMDYITDNFGNKPGVQVNIKIQSTDPNKPGACIGCGGSDGYGGTIGDFSKINPNLKITIEHGSRGKK